MIHQTSSARETERQKVIKERKFIVSDRTSRKAFCFCECLRSGNLRSTLEMISCNYAFAWCMDGFKSCLINCALQEWQRVGKQIPKISIRANRDSTKSTALVFGKISFICAICKAASRLQRDIAKFIGVDRFPAALVRRGEKNWECISFTHFSYCQSENTFQFNFFREEFFFSNKNLQYVPTEYACFKLLKKESTGLPSRERDPVAKTE